MFVLGEKECELCERTETANDEEEKKIKHTTTTRILTLLYGSVLLTKRNDCMMHFGI